MTMYICEICATPFDEPRKHVDRTVEDGRIRTDIELLCPICASPYFANADVCPKCREWKPTKYLLCRACRADLLRRLTEFADKLTAEEEQQLDDWMDGDTITNRGKWK